MKTYDELVSLFEEANLAFLQAEHSLFRTEVAERTLCGALMLHIHDIIKEDDSYSGYYADVEYNRNAGGIKTIRKTIRGQQEEIIPINCDLILHSRGENVDQDNLIAIEMKKSNAPSAEKQKDRERLIALTKDSFDDVWAWDHNLPEHVCRYVLGVYYEINYRQKEIYIEYYRRGELVEHMLQLFPLLRMLLHPLVCGSGSFRVHGAYPAPVRLKLFIRLGILEGHELTALSAFTKSLQFGTFRFCDFSLSNSRRTISPG